MEQFLLIEESFKRKNKQSKTMHIMAMLLAIICGLHAFQYKQYILLTACLALVLIIGSLLFFAKEILERPMASFSLRLLESGIIGVVGILLFLLGNKISGACFTLSAIMLVVTGFFELRIAGDRYLQLHDKGLNFTGRQPQAVLWHQVKKIIFTPNLVSITLTNDHVVQKSIELSNQEAKIDVLNDYCSLMIADHQRK